jgi:ABC-type dipeptide/oligopeptide/nickel transport system, ATPase component
MSKDRNQEKLLDIRDLSVHYFTDGGTVRAIEHLNLELGYGETLGLVGETVLARQQQLLVC